MAGLRPVRKTMHDSVKCRDAREGVAGLKATLVYGETCALDCIQPREPVRVSFFRLEAKRVNLSVVRAYSLLPPTPGAVGGLGFGVSSPRAASGTAQASLRRQLARGEIGPEEESLSEDAEGEALSDRSRGLTALVLLSLETNGRTPKFQLGSQTNQVVGVLVSICTKKFYYITLLRDPVSRYLSEWRHVQRGATWKTSLHMCDGRTPTPEELPSCYEGTDWSGCTLQEFMDCPYNLANNRQVRMLADLSLVGCYNMSFIPENKRAQILLESAKKNLKDMAFFGLTEFQRKTQYLFERTFNLKFIRPFMQYNSTRAGGVEVDNDTIRRIEELNDLDMQLYDYAKDLFQQRYQYKRQLERMEQRIKNREERLLHRSNEALPKEETEEQGRLPTEDYMSHIIEKW
nr:PREDICTED: heparan-sulfate 6-O-sulfotransferase 1-like [Balearica regulorum gibbericeps]